MNILTGSKRSRDLWHPHCVGASAPTPLPVSVGAKGPAPSGHTLIGRTGLAESFLSFYPYENPLSFPG